MMTYLPEQRRLRRDSVVLIANIERATWKRMCREAQAENKLARAELQHVHVELGKAQEDNRTQQNARLTVESRLADALQDAKGAQAQLTALEKELRVESRGCQESNGNVGDGIWPSGW